MTMVSFVENHDIYYNVGTSVFKANFSGVDPDDAGLS